jgi:hypothetical protein
MKMSTRMTSLILPFAIAARGDCAVGCIDVSKELSV